MIALAPPRPVPTVNHANPDNDERRFRRLFDAHLGLVVSVVKRAGVAHDRVDDVAQRVFVVAARRLATIEPDREAAFLAAVAARTAAESKRRDPRRREVALDEPYADVAIRDDDRPDAIAERHEALALAVAAFESLPDDLREVYTRVELADETLPRVAEALGVPVGTATSRLRRAREHLRDEARRLERGPALGRDARARVLAAGLAALVLARTTPAGATPAVATAGIGLGAKGALLVVTVGLTAALVWSASRPAPPPVASPAASSFAASEARAEPSAVATPVASLSALAPIAVSSLVDAPPVPTASAARAPVVGASAVGASRTADTLADELAIVDEARQALRERRIDDATRSLSRYAARFPAGALADEARVLAIDVARARGDADGAATLARAFLRERPKSPQAARVKSTLAELTGGVKP